MNAEIEGPAITLSPRRPHRRVPPTASSRHRSTASRGRSEVTATEGLKNSIVVIVRTLREFFFGSSEVMSLLHVVVIVAPIPTSHQYGSSSLESRRGFPAKMSASRRRASGNAGRAADSQASNVRLSIFLFYQYFLETRPGPARRRRASRCE